MPKRYQDEIKGIKLLQDRANKISDVHEDIAGSIDSLKQMLAQIDGAETITESDKFKKRKQRHVDAMSTRKELEKVELTSIYQEASAKYTQDLGLTDILTLNDFKDIEKRQNLYVKNFNKRYSLDGWDYAIAGGCGLVAGMLDMICVSAPPKPTVSYTAKVDGIFNRGVQKAFNHILPTDLAKLLESSKNFKIGSADASVVRSLIDAPPKTLNPINHRLRALSHDPILGFIFGVKDMINGTCTIVQPNGIIKTFKSIHGPTEGNIFQLLGRMFGHLLSDVNTPSAKGNRGMGLPAPFMGLLRMFDGIEVPSKLGDPSAGTSTFGKQIEWMYTHGYDFRQFLVTSIPVAIMEVLLRVFYVVKQTKVHGQPFGEAMLDTIPTRISPRFRILLALSYGTLTAINTGKVYCTQNILNANYAAWGGFAWNTFHALKWALVQKHTALWNEITKKELQELENMVAKMDALMDRAAQLPT